MNTSGLINKIATQLAQELLSGSIAPGDHMVAQQIADKYSVSRTPVRDALITLEKFNLLERQPHRGYFVTEKSPQSKAQELLKQLGGDADYYLQLVDDWLSDELPDTVTEQYLRQRYDLTKTRLNDLLARAAREGWAEPKEGYGWRFLPVAKTAEAFDDIYRFRLAIEPAALLEPGFEANFRVLTELRRTQEKLLEVDLDHIPAEQLLASGSTFHEELIKLSNNAYFYSALQRVNQMRRLMEYRAKINRERLIGQCNQHLEIISHLESGEIIEASYLMRRHLQSALKRKSAVVSDTHLT